MESYSIISSSFSSLYTPDHFEMLIKNLGFILHTPEAPNAHNDGMTIFLIAKINHKKTIIAGLPMPILGKDHGT